MAKKSNKLIILNYAMYRNDRIEQPKGGTAILIKKDIMHIKLEALKSQTENTIIQLEINKEEIVLIAAYSSPKTHIKQEDLQPFFNTDKTKILMGDLNAKHT